MEKAKRKNKFYLHSTFHTTSAAHSAVNLLKATRAVIVCNSQPSATIVIIDNKRAPMGMCLCGLYVNTVGYLVSVLGLCL